MEEGEQTVRGPGGVEVVISFLPNNEILVRAPPPFVVRTEVGFSCTNHRSDTNPKRSTKRDHKEESKEENDHQRENLKRTKVRQPENETVGLESLPSEVHHLLCNWLPFDTLAHLNEVCSFWKVIMDDETLWRRRYTLAFGPLSRCHLTLPLPPQLGAAIVTPTKVLKWKKRFVMTRNLSQCRDVALIKSWPLLHGCSQLTMKMMCEKYRGADPKPDIALSAILVDDIDVFEETLRDFDLTSHTVSKNNSSTPDPSLLIR